VNQADALACASTVISYNFRNPDLFVQALTHSSLADTRVQSNERLEFLGDSVLGLIICMELYDRFGDWLEGELTKVKSVLVSRRICALVADEIGLTEHLLLGNGIENRAQLPTSLRAAVFESVVGSIFLDGGLEPAKQFVLRVMGAHIDRYTCGDNHENYKSALQQYAQRWLSATPRYETLDEQGPDHSKCFEVCVVIDGQRFPGAWGPSKKQAEQEAAQRALQTLAETYGTGARHNTKPQLIAE
jgi:ribonuclease III